MKKFNLILTILLATIAANSQPLLPQGVPSSTSPKWIQVPYLGVDSALIIKGFRDTTFKARYPTIVCRVQDTSLYYSKGNGGLWAKLGSGGSSAIDTSYSGLTTRLRLTLDSLILATATNLKLDKSDSTSGGYYPFSSNPKGYISSFVLPTDLVYTDSFNHFTRINVFDSNITVHGNLIMSNSDFYSNGSADFASGNVVIDSLGNYVSNGDLSGNGGNLGIFSNGSVMGYDTATGHTIMDADKEYANFSSAYWGNDYWEISSLGILTIINAQHGLPTLYSDSTGTLICGSGTTGLKTIQVDSLGNTKIRSLQLLDSANNVFARLKYTNGHYYNHDYTTGLDSVIAYQGAGGSGNDTTKVPYTGATGNVNLGTHSITANALFGGLGSVLNNGYGINTFSFNNLSSENVVVDTTAIASKSFVTTTNALNLKYTDTAAMLNNYRTQINSLVSDTSYQAAQIALRVKYTDTSTMLSPYVRTSNLPSLSGYVKYTDTASMLNNYRTQINSLVADTNTLITRFGYKVNYTDTASMLSPYLQSAKGVKYTDTASLVSPYLRKSDTASMLANRLKISDTLTMLSNRLKISDTLTMLNPYLRKIDTTGRWIGIGWLSTLNGKVNKADSSINGGYYPYSSNPKNYLTSFTVDSSFATGFATRATLANDSLILATAINAKGSGTVTSVATGYGLSGGTITSTGNISSDTTKIIPYTDTLKTSGGIATQYYVSTHSGGSYSAGRGLNLTSTTFSLDTTQKYTWTGANTFSNASPLSFTNTNTTLQFTGASNVGDFYIKANAGSSSANSYWHMYATGIYNTVSTEYVQSYYTTSYQTKRLLFFDGNNGNIQLNTVYLQNQVVIGSTTNNSNSLLYFTHNSNVANTQLGASGIQSVASGANGGATRLEFLVNSGNNPTVTTNDRAMSIIHATKNILIGNSTTDVPSSILTMSSTTQGFLKPSMTTTQVNAITSPATGLELYDNTLNVNKFYNSTAWDTYGSLAATQTWNGVNTFTGKIGGSLYVNSTSYGFFVNDNNTGVDFTHGTSLRNYTGIFSFWNTNVSRYQLYSSGQSSNSYAINAVIGTTLIRGQESSDWDISTASTILGGGTNGRDIIIRGGNSTNSNQANSTSGNLLLQGGYSINSNTTFTNGYISLSTVPNTSYGSGNLVERLRVKQSGQVKFIPLSSAPSSPEEGDTYYDGTTHKMYTYDGTSWQAHW